MKSLEVQDRSEWRDWLAEHHDQETEIWLVYYKKGTGVASIDYNSSVEEALCYGWVDSLIKKIDDRKYARKFTPRKDDSKWSPSNIKRVKKLIEEGSMTEVGLQKVEAAKQSGHWDEPAQSPELSFEMHPEFARALNENERAKKTFERLAPTYQKQYLGWIEVAKRPETRQKRIEESIRLLERGEKLGLK
jgi:uncharacterized protein YdeI (YjbR/CyaY-like superfamily)